MKLFECVVALGMFIVLFSFVQIRSNHSLEVAYSTLISHLKMLQLFALSDDNMFIQAQDARDMLRLYPSLDVNALVTQHRNAMWQIQFHLGKIYTTHSYSLYIDTPRMATTTNFDSRPMAGDIILKDMDRKCLSAYNNTNTAMECKNNALAEIRLGERFGVENILIESDNFCKERETARIYFDRRGVPYCGKIPTALRSPFKITLFKGSEHKSLCVLPQSGVIRTKC
ncbi:hypothetical protein LS66_002720 [Helicobacter sp. MIT 03-1614]|uniref:hypothetical protein n=1 Tax=Helicobacter sp. MIT 03-1614 TaxID=1548147 RepID=UPI000512CB02|nr:hypothetical protein [Helicobacter sp. MIT 03-1614]TLD90402.1 hypothetical protein LS66_002720 [Helicobacter sp. MIT 03-1614]